MGTNSQDMYPDNLLQQMRAMERRIKALEMAVARTGRLTRRSGTGLAGDDPQGDSKINIETGKPLVDNEPHFLDSVTGEWYAMFVREVAGIPRVFIRRLPTANASERQ